MDVEDGTMSLVPGPRNPDTTSVSSLPSDRTGGMDVVQGESTSDAIGHLMFDEAALLDIADILNNVANSPQKLFGVSPFPQNDVHTIITCLRSGCANGDVYKAMIACQDVLVESEMSQEVIKILDLISIITFIDWYDGIKS